MWFTKRNNLSGIAALTLDKSRYKIFLAMRFLSHYEHPRLITPEDLACSRI